MKNLKVILLVLLSIAICPNLTNAQSSILSKLGNALKNTTSGTQSDKGNAVTSIIEGLFTKTDLQISDLEGTWKSSGPAVAFQGDNFLKQAGGKAAAAVVENKVAPYYKKYGLNNAVLTVNTQGEFTLTIGKVPFKGIVSQGPDKGIFYFEFKALGKINMGKVKTYVQQSSSKMDVMFDATKLISLIEAVAKYSNMSTVKTLSSLLASYDGLCLGFEMQKVQ